MKRLGPELKMPKFKGGEVKAPAFLTDLYQDLRDRRLLPLVGLLLVAIVATPFLLGGSGGEEPAAPAAPLAEGSASNAGQALQVVQAEPGLRNYRKRLRRRQPVDPFHQRYTGAELKGAQLQTEEPTTTVSKTEASSGSGAGGTTPSTSEETAPVTGGEGASPGGGNGGGSNDNSVPPGRTIYTLEVTLQVTRIETKPDGTVDKKGPTVYKDVQAPAALPGEKTPVITYLGMGSKGRVPMFLVSDEVTQIFGEANCISGGDSCQLLVLEEGFPVTFVYGDNDVRYKINLVKAEPVITGHS